MKIFITGMRGFLGSHLAQSLGEQGHHMLGSSTKPGGMALLRMGEPVHPSIFEDADTVVHCAHDFSPGALELNVAGSRLLLNAASGRRQIFVSSHSARPDAVSEYGMAKFRIERLYLDAGQTAVRPGVVIGAGGGFAAHLRMIRNSPVIPLIDDGRDPVAVLAISDFARAIIRVIETGNRSVYNLFNQAEPSMRQMVDTLLRLDGRHASIVSIPYALAAAGVKTAELFRLPLSFSSGSLQTLKLNRRRVHESTLRELLDAETSVETAIAETLERLR